MSDSNDIMNTNATNANGAAEPTDWILLHRYLENRVDPQERLNVEEILRTNAAARRTLDALREEQRLLREALEVRAEPSHRLGDKVLFQLYAEERTRQQAARSRRWRRHASIGIGIAAAVALCIFLIRPRDAAGTAEYGAVAQVVPLSGDVRLLTHGTRIYEGDCVYTLPGQFIRLKLFNKSHLDLDESSRIVVEKGGNSPALRLLSGRLGLNAIGTRNTAVIYLPQGSVTVPPGAQVDVWLPQPSNAIGALAPALLPGAPLDNSAKSSDLSGSAVVTVLKGSINVANEQSPNGVTLSDGQRIVFTAGASIAAGSSAISKIDMGELLEARDDSTCWNKQETGPQDRSALGLLDEQDYVDLGRRLKMDVKIPAPIPQALQSLQAAHAEKTPAERAAKLSAGQTELRRAYDVLELTDVRRPYTRMVEGLAHSERGRLLADTNGKPEASASSAFEAACVAFEEALRPNAEDTTAKPANAWIDELKKPGLGIKLADLPSSEQSALLATFHHAVALYWQARSGDKARAKDAAAEFESLFQALGHHIESLEAKYGEGLSYGLTGEHDKAIETFKLVLAVPLAGCADNSRRIGEGIRQSTLLALTREYIADGKLTEARQVAEQFKALYPLEPANPALLEIQSEIGKAK